MGFELDKSRLTTITKLTGQCPHEFGKVGYCKMCGKFYTDLLTEMDNLTTSPKELMLLIIEKLVSRGLWDEFYKLTEEVYVDQVSKEPTKASYHVAWLLSDPTRFAWMVSEFLGKQPNAEPRT